MCYTKRQYDNRVRDLRELEMLKADIEAQIKRIEDDIKSDMGDTEFVQTDHFRIGWQRIISNRFDTKTFKAAHEKLYSQFVKPSESRRFTWTEV